MSETPATTEAPATTTDESKSFSAEYVKDLRDEAARYRTEKKDAVDSAKTEARSEVIAEYEPQLAERDTQIATLNETVASQGLELQKLKAVLGASVPTEDVITVSELVQGSDEESISESVKRVMSIYGKTAPAVRTPAVDPSQGTGGHIPLNGNPVLDALKRAVGAS